MQIKDLTSSRVVSPAKVDAMPAVGYAYAKQSSACEIPFYRQLGRTELKVSCLGLGGGGGISSENALYAFEQGINCFFYSSDLHHHIYSFMSGALRQLCGRKSSVREQVILGTVTYLKHPQVAMAALMDQFIELGIDYIDIFFWGWIDSKDGPAFQSQQDLIREHFGMHP